MGLLILGEQMDKYKVNIPEGCSGDWRVEHFEVTEDDEKFERLRAIISGRGRFVPAGKYIRLIHKGRLMDVLVMSDTPDEIRDHLEAIHKARGHVLVNGLGLGIVIQAMLNKPEVEKVTVIEISPDVIALVGPHYQTHFGDRLEIIEADAFTWQPPKGVRYDVVWHDIWNDICADNLPEMHKLHRKYGRRAGWQGSWCRWRCEEQRDRGW